MNENIEGKIAAILDRSTVVINRGSDQGVEKGTEFYIYSKLGPFFDPDSGDNLGEATKIWGKVKATIIEKRFCVAETQYHQTSPFLYPMFEITRMFRTEKVELPVDEDDITPFTEKIKVGFPVMSVPRIREIENKEVLELTSDDDQDLGVEETDSEQDKKENHDQEAD
jgi:hypothetical protein